MKLKDEPAVITSVLVAAVGAAATLGIIGTTTQDQLVAVITAVVPIIGGLIVRANVTPNSKTKTSPSTDAMVQDLVNKISPAALQKGGIGGGAPVEPTPAPEPPADPTPAPAADPAPVAPAREDPVKAQLKAAIEQVRANSNAQNDARAAAATAAVDAQP